MNFRPLQPGDAPAYHALRRQAVAEAPQFVGPTGEREALSGLTDLQARMETHACEGVHVFGCFREADCVAAAGLNRSPNPKYAHKMFLWGMYVLPEHRGRSIGSRLLEELLAFARCQEGVRFVNLQVTLGNERAIALYRSRGFVSYGREPAALRLNDGDYDFEMMQLALPDAGFSRPH